MNSKGQLAIATLSHWSMDFEDNHKRIEEGIRLSKQQGNSYRLQGTTTSYDTEDQFYEADPEMNLEFLCLILVLVFWCFV